MEIAFRVDSSRVIGTGHVRRCLLLAKLLKANGAAIEFICRELQDHLADFIKSAGFSIKLLPALQPDYSISENNIPPHANWLGTHWQIDAEQTIAALDNKLLDFIVIDHYAIEGNWETFVRPYAKNIFVIDDLADRKHDCDFLLDQTYKRDFDNYQYLLKQACTVLLGTQFALLRSEFYELREASVQRQSELLSDHLVITMGGTDINNLTATVLQSLECLGILPEKIKITVVMASLSPHLKQVRQLARKSKYLISIETNVKNMAALMASCDYAIGAAGTSTWERCCLGIPTILIPIASNQNDVCESLQKEHAVIVIEEEKLKQSMPKAILTLIKKRKDFSKTSLAICDGLGGYRTIQYFFPLKDKDDENTYLRQANIDDIAMVYQWQLLPETRRFAIKPEIPSFDEHTNWMQHRLHSLDCFFYIIQKNKRDVGVLRLDKIKSSLYEISIYLIPLAFAKGIASNAIVHMKSIHRNSDILATVLEANLASKKLFITNGFMPFKEQKYIYRSKTQ